MKILKVLKNNLAQVFAITEKNIKLNLRFKYGVIFSFFTPIIWILMPLIVMGQLFQLSEQFGSWTRENYFVYQFLAYNIFLLKGIITEFPSQFRAEKYWKTLPGLIIAPFNRFNLLFGIFISRLFLISIPFILFLILSYIFIPISFITFLFVLGIFFAISLIFSGIGLIFGVFAISNENISNFLGFGLNLLFWASCLSYPFEIFPEILQTVIILNPLYYLFNILRLTWNDNDPILTIISNPLSTFILFTCLIVIPYIGVFIFNRIFKKYGIVGY